MGDAARKYEERRALEVENALLRERAENDRLKRQAAEKENADAILNGVAALFSGRGSLTVMPENGGFTVRFVIYP